jgi:hypothetical protein
MFVLILLIAVILCVKLFSQVLGELVLGVLIERFYKANSLVVDGSAGANTGF